MAAVSWLSLAPVKGLGLVPSEEIVLERFGVLENRRFYVSDAGGRLVNGLKHSALFQVRPSYDPYGETLALRLPDGATVEAEVDLGEHVTADFYRRAVRGRVVLGPFAEALSSLAGEPVKLVQTDEPGTAVDRARGPVSLVSDESVEELARQAGRERVDAGRFRMLIGIRGVAPHEEDKWIGRDVRVGDAVVRPLEQVARCAITTKNPVTGECDLDTLRVIKEYRGVRGTKYLDFGIYGEVVTAGRVRVGDEVDPLS
ncbi:MAG TPA: MOSC domain-containing protein [Gaiellaceae bacterium]|nr:MOSC domain-containing protein [Gaiellaceae bacterium]